MTSAKVISHVLVFIQFAGIALSLLPVDQYSSYRPYYLSISLLGLLLVCLTLFYNRIGNFRIYPELKTNTRLITSGPYRFIRHPMYMSLLLAITGVSFCLNRSVNYIGLLLVVVAVLLKAHKEERLLADRFPEYKEYRRKTAGFVPFVW